MSFSRIKTFFIVPARDASFVTKKCKELDELGVDYIIICGEKVNYPHVVYREPKGKYDAINFGFGLVPNGVDIVVLNDVDTEIGNIEEAFAAINHQKTSLVFARVNVERGPQYFFYRLLDSLRRIVPIAASGELMLVRFEALQSIFPLKKCKAEDSYILFKVLELGGKVKFCEDCYVTTSRTENTKQERIYKRRTVAGIYQALSKTKPPIKIRLFYHLLPFFSVILLVLGKKGYSWLTGILEGYMDYLTGDKTGHWQNLY